MRSWPGNEIIPYPNITKEKIEKYNLDIFDHLDANDVEITVSSIEGLSGDAYLKIYAGNAPNERFGVKVHNGAQKEATTVIKLPEKEMHDLMKGDKVLIVIRLFEKSFWGNFSQLCEFPLKTIFIR